MHSNVPTLVERCGTVSFMPPPCSPKGAPVPRAQQKTPPARAADTLGGVRGGRSPRGRAGWGRARNRSNELQM
eukprot:9563785-Alexandrium_andersonii.AAC.1